MLLQMTYFIIFSSVVFHFINTTSSFIHSSADGCLDCFSIFATINSSAVTTGVHVCFWIMIFSRFMFAYLDWNKIDWENKIKNLLLVLVSYSSNRTDNRMTRKARYNVDHCFPVTNLNGWLKAFFFILFTEKFLLKIDWYETSVLEIFYLYIQGAEVSQMWLDVMSLSFLGTDLLARDLFTLWHKEAEFYYIWY